MVGRGRARTSRKESYVRMGVNIFAPTLAVSVQGLSTFMPTVIRGLGKFTPTQIQLRTIPPYVVAACWSVFISYLAWKVVSPTSTHGRAPSSTVKSDPCHALSIHRDAEAS